MEVSYSAPCLLRWVDRDPTAADVASVRDALRGWADSRVIRLGARRHLLLVSGAELDDVARVVRARRQDVHVCPYSLALVLEGIDRRDASHFVHDQLAALAEYDREHGTDLLRVLELALDHHDRNDAARAAFMHRNTFRRRLRQAETLVGADLACPEERLALHLALKLRALSRAS
jgi:DNA-binding PucR family transcriptional regulator